MGLPSTALGQLLALGMVCGTVLVTLGHAEAGLFVLGASLPTGAGLARQDGQDLGGERP